MTPQWSLEPCGRGGSPWRAPQNTLKHQQTPSKDKRFERIDRYIIPLDYLLFKIFEKNIDALSTVCELAEKVERKEIIEEAE